MYTCCIVWICIVRSRGVYNEECTVCNLQHAVCIVLCVQLCTRVLSRLCIFTLSRVCSCALSHVCNFAVCDCATVHCPVCVTALCCALSHVCSCGVTRCVPGQIGEGEEGWVQDLPIWLLHGAPTTSSSSLPLSSSSSSSS